MSMFPHTVTLYNVTHEVDTSTMQDVTKLYVTVLEGVLLSASKAANVRASGLEGADAVNLYIPFSVVAKDATTGKRNVMQGRRTSGTRRKSPDCGHFPPTATAERAFSSRGDFPQTTRLWRGRMTTATR